MEPPLLYGAAPIETETLNKRKQKQERKRKWTPTTTKGNKPSSTDVSITANSCCGTILLATRDGAQHAVNLFSSYLWHRCFLKVQITDAMGDDYVPLVFVENVSFFASR
jgi:hypothetical protein